MGSLPLGPVPCRPSVSTPSQGRMRGKPPVPRFAHAELGGLPGSPRRLSSSVRVGERFGNPTRRILAKCETPRSYAESVAEREARALAIGQDIWGAGGLAPHVLPPSFDVNRERHRWVRCRPDGFPVDRRSRRQHKVGWGASPPFLAPRLLSPRLHDRRVARGSAILKAS